MTTKTKSRSKSPTLRDGDFYFDDQAADRAQTFFERFLRHVKGRWAGEPFMLMPWQRDRIVRPLFGWKRADGTRRYRQAYVEVPKKNGKSETAAGIGLYLLSADDETGAEVYSVAGDREQAAIVFDLARAMTMASPALLKRCKPYKRSIIMASTASTYRVLSADAPTKHGLNAHGVIFDEVHVQPNRDLHDTLEGAGASRSQPVHFKITTAGYDRNSLCWHLHDHADKVLRGVIKDDSLLPVIFSADPAKDDWKDPATWRKANPSLGVTVSEDFLAAECIKAQEMPTYENTFKRLHLNIWTQQVTRWMPMDKWEASAGEMDPIDLRGLPCFAALDLATTTDVCALVLVFPIDGDYKVLPHFWIPEECMRQRVARDKVPYDVWVKQGLITATPGDVVDYAFILKKLKDLREEYDIREVAYDRWGAARLVQDMQEMSFNVVPFGQGFASMSGPTKELLGLVLAKRLHHGGNPVLRWMADNVVVRQDPAGNLKPDKEKSAQRIDGIVALIMALDRALRMGGGSSIYDTREPIVL